MDNVACSGTEEALTSCNHNGWGSHNCVHGEDAGVRCGASDTTTPLPDTTTAAADTTTTAAADTTADGREGMVRLVDGDSAADGRVEIFHDGEWGTVCDDSWGSSDAAVVCRALGFSGPAEGVQRWGGGTGQIWCVWRACVSPRCL